MEASSDNIPSKEAVYWQGSFPIGLVLQVGVFLIWQSHMFDLLLLSGSFLVHTLKPVTLFPLGGVARQQLYFLLMLHAVLQPFQNFCFRHL